MVMPPLTLFDASPTPVFGPVDLSPVERAVPIIPVVDATFGRGPSADDLGVTTAHRETRPEL